MRLIPVLNSLAFASALALVLSGCSTSDSKRGPAQEQDVTQASPRKAPSGHSHAAGMASLPTASLADCAKLGSLSTDASTAQKNAVFDVVGNRGHRLQHALWHAARSGFDKRDDSEVLKAFGAPWTEPHKYCPAPARDWSANYNPVGEDFLYMHRHMVGIVRGALVHNEPPLQCLAGWDSVQDTAHDPLPAGSQLTGAKSDQTFKQLLTWDAYFQGKVTVTNGQDITPGGAKYACPKTKTSCNWLETVSLSQLGMAVELTTHNNLHMRYASDQPPPGDFSGAAKTGGAPIPYNNVFPASWSYDQQGYDWLADPYGAAVNPTFWKIHGYVDSLIDKWASANGFDSVADSCGDETTCYTWKGKWAPDEPDANVAPGTAKEMAVAPPADDDPQTIAFNRARMLKQWTGVLGHPTWDQSGQDMNSAAAPRAVKNPRGAKPPVGKTPKPGGAAPATPAADPFVYAVQAECKGS